MDHDAWHDRWANNRIGFHASSPNESLVRFINEIAGSGRVFLPLCGKTLDIAWLIENGYQVVGAELSQIAIDALFEQLEIVPKIEPVDDLTRYSSDRVEIFVGDIFDLKRPVLGSVDAVFDRAALVALPPKMRATYAAHLAEITNCAPQLLVSFDYDQSAMSGPPHSVPEAEIRAHYDAAFEIDLLESSPVPGKLKGKVDAMETTWHLRRAG